MAIDVKQFAGKLTLLDGSWGVQFQNMGLQPGQCCEAWNLEAPEKVLQVARGYVEAGSEIILTNTFQGSRFALERHGLSDRAEAINRAGAELSRQAAAGKALVFGSIGPTGRLLMMGDVDQGEMYDAFAEQAKALAAGGADGIVVETMADVQEMTLAVRAVRENTDLPVVGSMTFESGADRTRTMMGVTVQQAIEAAAGAGAFAVGANCGLGVAGYVPVARLFRENTDLPVWIKPNAGRPVRDGDWVKYQQSPEDFAESAQQIIDLGVNFIGGCCGTGPEHIRLLKQQIDRT